MQKNVKFHYKDGTIIEDTRTNIINKVKNAISKTFNSNKTKKSSEQNKNYVINRKTNEFHLKDNECEKLNNVESKYLNETTATEKDLINAGLKACKKCIKKLVKN